MSSTSIYLDSAGSTPVHELVARAALESFSATYGNPSASHVEGLRARRAIDAASEHVARGLGCSSAELVWTSGGTESNNWALFGSAPSASSGHLIVSAIEHKSVLNAARELERRGHALTVLPVTEAGAVRPADLERALRPNTFLVSIMLANNETGVIQPWREIGALCRAAAVRSHCDAVAALGKLPLDVARLGCDLLSLSGHKLYSPKGCGVLYVRSGIELAPLIHGCGQQCGRRNGTENTSGAVGLGRAFELLTQGEFDGLRSPRLRDELRDALRAVVPDAIENGCEPRLPNTLSMAFPGFRASALQAELAARGVSVGTGAAAASGEASHVLSAMGFDTERARSTLRFTTGLYTDASHVAGAAEALREACAALRSGSAVAAQR